MGYAQESLTHPTQSFISELADQLDTSTVADLPDMRGSGLVRDLREAANDLEISLAA